VIKRKTIPSKIKMKTKNSMESSITFKTKMSNKSSMNRTSDEWRDKINERLKLIMG
jgi:hypothetical protein